MSKWYQNKYVQATTVAFVTGLIAAALVYAGTLTDGLDARHTIKLVALAFLGPFATLASVLPKIVDLVVPTVRIQSDLPLRATAALEEHVIETHEADNTVVVGD